MSSKDDESRAAALALGSRSAVVNEEDFDKQQLSEKRKNQSKPKADQRRNKILNQMSEMQKSFIRKNQDFFETTLSDSQTSPSIKMETSELASCEQCICLGPGKTRTQAPCEASKKYSCILCQEDQEISLNGPCMVMCAYIQYSKVLSKNRLINIENSDKFEPLFVPSNLFWGVHTTSCGHVMHSACWRKYVDDVKASENRRHGRFYNFNTKKNEFLCPLCETIGNTVLPLLPNLNVFAAVKTSQNVNINYEDWIDAMRKTLDNSIQKELQDDKDIFIINPCPLSSITKLMAEAVAHNFKMLFTAPDFVQEVRKRVYESEEMREESTLAAVSEAPASKEPVIAYETIAIVEVFARNSFVFGMIVHPNDDDPRMPITVWNNCAYTIQVMEQMLRLETRSLFGEFPARQFDLLSSLVKFSSIYSIAKKMNSVRDYLLKLLAAFLPNNAVLFDAVNIMNCDMFHMLVYLCFSMPHLYDDPKLASAPCGNFNEAYILRLVLQAHCTQIMLKKIENNSFVDMHHDFVCALNTDGTNIDANLVEKEESDINQIFEFILKKTTKIHPKFEKPTAKQLCDAIKVSLMPFLRCAAILFGHMTDIRPGIVTENDLENKDTFTYLCSYLGISNYLNGFMDLNSAVLKKMIETWCAGNVSENKAQVDYPININQLIELPADYVDLITLSQNNGQNNNDHAHSIVESDTASIMCLICGEILSNQSYVMQEEIGKNRVGLCTSHAYKCGKTVGMFLRVSECQILLLHLNLSAEEDIQVRGSFIPAPYLDDYGETDQGLRRGNPLHLCIPHYKRLHKSWLTHAIPDEVSRSYQNNQASLLSVDWITL